MSNKGIGVGDCAKHGEYFLDADDSPCPSCEDCTCNNSVFWDGIRYCPDCNTHTPAFTTAELNRKVQEILHKKAKEELLENDGKQS